MSGAALKIALGHLPVVLAFSHLIHSGDSSKWLASFLSAIGRWLLVARVTRTRNV
jgi:hypothetical protein